MIRLAVRCSPELADRVLADLLELAPGGVEEERGEGWVEYAVYGPPGELPRLPELEVSGGGGHIEVSSTEIPDDWADRWRDFHRPVSVADGRLTVLPSWEQRPSPQPSSAPLPRPAGRETSSPAAVEVVVDPGQAFGTGAHPTTQLCLELLVELADRGRASGALVDLGTGSGVLAIAAAKLGWDPVSGCDSEVAALDAAGANAVANGVEIGLSRINLRLERPPLAPTVVCNLTAPLLAEVAARMTAAPLPERLICSGLLAEEIPAVRDAFAPVALRPVAIRRSGEWAAICFAVS